MRRALLAVFVVVGLWASPLAAQLTFDVGPTFVFYRPLGQFDEDHLKPVDLPLRPSAMRGQAVGWHGGMWLGRRFGIQARGVSVNGTVGPVVTPAGPFPAQSVEVRMITAQGLYDVSLSPRSYRSWLSLGAAHIRHGGEAYSRYGNPGNWAPAIGVGAAAPAKGNLHFEAGVSMLFYNFDVPYPPEYPPGSFEHGFQKDALFHLGLTFSLP